MNADELEIFAVLEELEQSCVQRNPRTIRVESHPVNSIIDEQFIEIFSVIDQHQDWIRPFEIKFSTPDGRSDKAIIRNSNGLKTDSQALGDALSNSEDTGRAEINSRLSVAFENGTVREAILPLRELLNTNNEFYINFTLKKEAIVQILLEEAELEENSFSPYLWGTQEDLSDWTGSESTETVVDRLFEYDSPPFHIFVDSTESSQSDYLGFYSASKFTQNDKSRIIGQTHAYEREYESVKSLLKDENVHHEIIPPTVFNAETVREVFNREFVFSTFSLLSEQTTLSGDDLDVSIKTNRNVVEGSYELPIDFDTEDCTTLYELVTEIVGSSQSSVISHWRQSIATYCNGFDEIPDEYRQIVHYYDFLQKESAKEELEQIQETIEEVFQLTRTIGEAFSEASESLSSELQRVTVAVLGAIVTNFVLILRYSDFPVLFPFSVVAVSGILIFYFPLVQERINRAEEMMAGRSGDFSMYLEELRSHVGNRVLKLEEILNQRDAYKMTAARTLRGSRRFLQRVYLLLVATLAIVTIYAAFLTIDLPPSVSKPLTTIGVPLKISDQVATIQITRTVASVPAIWILWKMLSHRLSTSSTDPSERFEVDDMDTGHRSYFDAHPYLLYGLLAIIIISAIVEPVWVGYSTAKSTWEIVIIYL